MLKLGQYNTLRVLRETSVGLFLGDSENSEVLLPRKYVKRNNTIDSEIEVFVYKDSEDRIIATSEKPLAQVNEFAFLEVVSVNKNGAFLNWGLEKDLFVPFKEQRHKMFEGFSYVVFIYIDNVTNRLVASSKLNKFLNTNPDNFQIGQVVDLLVYDQSDLGYSCVINNSCKGLLYTGDVFQKIKEGDKLKGYVKFIRPDKLIDLSLQPIGFRNVLSSTDIILNYLNDHNGFCDLTDSSSPEEISRRFQMSKATFKKSIGILYRQRKVLLKPDGVYLVNESDEIAN
jgi:predicted RNA-binding protein (virulence factor B family)